MVLGSDETWLNGRAEWTATATGASLISDRCLLKVSRTTVGHTRRSLSEVGNGKPFPVEEVLRSFSTVVRVRISQDNSKVHE